MKSSVLTEHRRHFEERGAFFHAVLGLVSFSKRLSVLLTIDDDAERSEQRRGAHVSDYLYLGIISLQRRVQGVVDWLPQDHGKPRHRPKTSERRRSFLR